MGLHILGECTSCSVCEPECPNAAITEGSEIFVIDPELCTECVGAYDEPQCVAVCPVDCIELNPAREESQETLLARYHQIHGAE